MLTPAQQAWYAKKSETQLADMKREYPSTPEEAFEASVEGACYSELLATAEVEGRIGEFPAEEGVPVDTAGTSASATKLQFGFRSAWATDPPRRLLREQWRRPQALHRHRQPHYARAWAGR